MFQSTLAVERSSACGTPCGAERRFDVDLTSKDPNVDALRIELEELHARNEKVRPSKPE